MASKTKLPWTTYADGSHVVYLGRHGYITIIKTGLRNSSAWVADAHNPNGTVTRQGFKDRTLTGLKKQIEDTYKFLFEEKP